MTPREELIEIQKRIVARLEAEMRRCITDDSPMMRRYRHEYEREIQTYSRTATQRELVQNAMESDIIFCGDYHTLSLAQRTPLRLLHQAVHRGGKVIIAMEMVYAKHQAVLDRYIEGKIDDEAFLKEVDYRHTWNFTWENYKVIFDFAREHNLRVLGINTPGRSGRHHLKERDEFSAEVIVNATVENPDAIILVMDGDWHIASVHLPAEVRKRLDKRRAKRKLLTVFQNSTPIYWLLAKRRLAHRIDVVQLGKNVYCVINATPLVKLQSFLNWEEGVEELGYADLWEKGVSRIDYTEQVLQIIDTITSYLDIEVGGLDNFTVYSTADLDFLEVLAGRGDFTAGEIDEIKKQIEHDESYFILKGNIIYLANLSLNHAAEEATHFINITCSGYPPEVEDSIDEFYHRTLTEAIGFLGSKIINHKRECYRIDDYRQFLEEHRGEELTPEMEIMRTVSKLILQHHDFEHRYMQTGKLSGRPRKIYSQAIDVHLGITHGLGYMLGNQLYQAMVCDAIPRDEVRDLFFVKFYEPGVAIKTYFDMCRRLGELQPYCREEGDHWDKVITD
jgi:uncharacterized iron-regulated protein